MYRIGEDLVAIVTDTACDLTDEQLTQHDIRLIPLRILTSTGEFRDRFEISADNLYQLLQTEIPKTSLPMPEDVLELYRQLRSEGATRILHLCMSGALSGTHNMVSVLASEFEGLQVDVFDARTLSCGLGLLVLEASECLAQGMSVESVLERLARLRKHQLGAFVIRTLEFLRKGGRIGLVEGVVGTLLNIKPVIHVNDDGVYAPMVKARGFSKALEAMKEEFFKRYQGRKIRVAIVHGNAGEEARRLLEDFRANLEVVHGFVAPVSPALAIHTGPGLLGAIVQYAD